MFRKSPALSFAVFLCTAVSPLFAGSGEMETTTSSKTVITLEEAYDRALATDQSIQIAYWEIRKGNLQPWSALTRLGPNLTGNASLATRQQGSFFGSAPTTRATATGGQTIVTTLPNGTVETTTQTVFSAPASNRNDTTTYGLSFSQTILDLTVIPAYRLGRLTAQAARLQYQFTIREVLFGVAQAYYEVLKQQRVVAVSSETVNLAEHQLDFAQKRADVGEVTRADVLRARVVVESDRQTLITAENTLEQDLNNLRNILNLPPDFPLQVAEPSQYPTTLPAFNALLTQAYDRREDLRAQGIAIDQDVQRRNEVVASYGPRVVAQWNQDTTKNTGSDRSTSWNASIGVSMPFLTGGQRELDLISAQYQIHETRLNYDKLVKTVEQDVKNAWLTVRTLQETLKALHVQVDSALQAYEDIQNQYRAGTATSVDVLSALNDLNVSRRDLAAQSYDYQVALRNLEQTSGVFQQERVQRLKFR
jgi:outer membrane protein